MIWNWTKISPSRQGTAQSSSVVRSLLTSRMCSRWHAHQEISDYGDGLGLGGTLTDRDMWMVLNPLLVMGLQYWSTCEFCLTRSRRSRDRLKNCINIELQNSTTILEMIYFIYGIKRRTMTSHNFLSRGVVREMNFLCPQVRESSFPENYIRFWFSLLSLLYKHGSEERVTKIGNKWSVKTFVVIGLWFGVWKVWLSYGLPLAYVIKAHICNGLRGSIWESAAYFNTNNAYVSGIRSWCAGTQCYVPCGLREGACYSRMWPGGSEGGDV